MQNTLFGVVGLTLGFLTPAQLSHALYIQEVRKNVKRDHSRLGEICVELNYLSPEQIEFIVERSRVLRLSPFMRPQPIQKPVSSTTSEEDESEGIETVHAPVAVETPTGNERYQPLDAPEMKNLLSYESGGGQTLEKRYECLKSRYDTAVEQVTTLTEAVQNLRERELELAIRAETAEYEVAELRQRLSSIEKHLASRNKGFRRVFGR